MFKQPSFKLILVSALMLFNATLKATVTPYSGTTLQGTTAPVIVTSTSTASVTIMTDPTFKDKSVTDIVTLAVNHQSTLFLPTAGNIIVGLRVDKWDKNNVSMGFDSPFLELKYQPFPASGQPYVDKSVFKFNGAYKYTITVQSMTFNGSAITNLPNNLFISTDILLERYINFSSAVSTEIGMLPYVERDLDCDGINDELELKWSTLAGAEEYQLEWAFVNDYLLTGDNKDPLSISYNFKNNSTRINTGSGITNYKLNLNFDRGYLVYRVRGIGRDFTDTSVPIPGAWNLVDSNLVGLVPVNSFYQIVDAHESNKNWQYSATYAEEGKKKEVINYFDGSLRNRQSVTKVNSDTTSIVGETIYDHQGRAAINILPAPVRIPSCSLLTSGLHYYPNLNTAENTAVEYSRTDFDLDYSGTDSCRSKLNKMDTGLGSSRYYSPANTEKSGVQAFVPDAEKYPFSQVEYTPDNTGRIRRQGGVGAQFQLDTQHETKYYYGAPAQPQLDRLFGSEVGDASHYKKNIVVDANKQSSVTYLDQEGRTIATALAGTLPAGMDSTLTPNKKISGVVVDLFNKDIYGNSTKNTVSLQGDAIEFSTQLLVAFTSTYVFNYDMKIPQYESYPNGCLKSGVCFNCVYDLEITVTDDCGKIVASSTTPNPIKNIIGRFTTDGSGNVSFNTTCNGADYTDAETFTFTNLAPGNYTIAKKLAVNKAAKDYYISEYFKTTNTPVQGTYVNLKPACNIKTYQQFVDAAMAKIDTTDCNVSCTACVAALKGNYATLELARDGFVADGKGTELDFDFLLDQCTSPCKEVSVCEANYEMMLMDVSPDGQYGEFQPRADGKAADMNLSVFNPGNRLTKNDGGTANWLFPSIMVNGNTYAVYIDKNGVRTKVRLMSTGNTNGAPKYSPDVTDITKVYYDAATQSYYTYPENLKYLSDFVARWDDNWAKSLVSYHPEYPYYQYCLDYNKKWPNFLCTSDTFDSLLVRTQSYAIAASRGLVKVAGTAGSPASMILLHQLTGDNRRDPFVNNFGTYGSQLLYNATESYGTTAMSMAELAARTARCGTRYGEASPATSCGDFGKGTDTVILNNEWNIFKNLYLSEKQRIQRLRDEDYAKTKRACNACFNNPNYDPLAITGMITTPFFSCPFFDNTQPCGYFLQQFYIDKKKRFNVSTDVEIPTKEQNDYQLYLQTNQTPMEINFQGFLNRLAKDTKLTTSQALLGYPEFSQDLYMALNGPPTPLPPAYVPYTWQYGSVVGHVLSADIRTGPTVKCTISMTKDAAISSFNNIVGISQLKYDGMNGALYKFKAVAAVANAIGSIRPYTYYTITGSSNFVLNGYTPNPVTVNKCKPNPLALDLARLWSAIALTGNLNSAGGFNLNTTDYIPFLTKNIKNALGTTSNALTWKYVSGTPVKYELYEVTGKKMVMQVDSSNTNSFERFVNMKNIDSNNGFRVTGTNAAGTYVGKIKGVINIISGATTPVNLGECGLPENALCTGNEFQSGKDLLKLLKSVMLPKPFNTNPDLTKSVAYTPLLESYLGTPVGSSTTKIDYFILNGANDYKEVITYNLVCKCQIKLWHKGKGSQVVRFSDLSTLNTLVPYGPANSDNNKYSFYLNASYPGSITDTIFGESCFPLRSCDNQIVADTSISPIKPYVTPCILNQLNMAAINAQNEFKKYSDSLLTDFSSRYTKHCLTAFENFKTTYDDREFHYTLYYYDQAGNLVKTIPPEGVEFDTAYFAIKKDRSFNRHDHFTSHRLATTYTYNSLNQLIRQCVPDQDSMDIWEYTLSNGLDSRLKVNSTQFISSTKGYLTGNVDFTGPPAYSRGYLYTTDDGGSTWIRMKNLVASDLKKIQMVTATVGYAVGTNGTVLKTNDGGSSWDMLSVPTTTTFNDLIFNPNQVLNGLIIGDNNTLYITLDGGATWSPNSNGQPLLNGVLTGASLTSITYDGGYFHMTGNLNGNGYIFRVPVNSFATSSFYVTLPWIQLSPVSNTGIRATDILKINMVDINRGFAVSVDGNLLKTLDKGLNWSAVPTGISNEFRDVYFLKMNGFAGNPLNGVAIIDSIPGKGLLYQTNDGGSTWKQLGPSDGNYYNAIQFIIGPGYRDRGYVVGSKIKRIVYKNNNFALVNVPMPANGAVELKTVYFSDPNNGWVAGTYNAYFTHNGMAPSPTWTEVAVSGLTIKKIYFDNTQNSGLALTPDGSIYRIAAGGANYAFTKISTASDYFMDINAGFTRVYALTRIGAPNVLRSVTKPTVGTLGVGGLATPSPSGTVTSTNAAAFTTFAVEDSTESVVIVGGTDGRLFQGLTTPTTVAWNDYSRRTVPLPLYSIESPGANVIFAVGAEGTLLQCTDQNTYRVIPTRSTVQYNAIKFNKNGFVAMSAVKGLIAGNGGAMTKLDVTASNVITSTPIAAITTADLNDIAIKNAASKAYVAGAGGTLISIPDLDNPVPVVASPKPAGDFKGISFTLAGNDVFAVGNTTAIYNYNGTNGAKINGVYTPALTDVSFVNPMDGYVIGDKLIRYTPDGGTTWNYVAASPTAVMNAVGTYAPGKALIVGNSSYLGTVSGTVVSHGTTTGTCYDIEFSGSIGYMVGAVAQKITISGGVPSYSTPPGTFPAGSTFRAVHIFPNGSFITVGDLGKIYCNKTAWVSIPLPAGATPILRDVYFHDDRNGYVVGDAGAIYKCRALLDVFTYPTPPSPSPWSALSLAGTNGAASPGNTNLTVITFTDRYKGFIAGYATSGTPINFARVVNDESKLFTNRFWYDALGRMVLSQNTKQYNRKNISTQLGRSDYSYTFYDALGRIVEVGEKTDNATGTTFAGMFGEYIGGKYNPYVINGVNFSTWANGGAARREVTRTTYDIALSSFPQNIVQQNLRKRVSAITYEDVNDGIDTTYQHGTFYTYDIHGNVKTLWQCNKQSASASQQLKRMDYDYDLISGKVNLVRYQDGQADCFYHFYTYDADNRLREVYTSSYPWQGQLINQRMVEKNKLWSKDAKYFYYAHGLLARVETGELISQGTDYTYTLQGWIKGVNSNILSPANDIGGDGKASTTNANVGLDAFGYSLSYFMGDYKPIDAAKWTNVPTRFEADMTSSYLLGARSDLYNGNIGAMVTNMSQPKLYSSAINEFPTLQPQGTAYKYDQLNRLKNAQSYINISTTNNAWGGSGLTVLQYLNSFTYDGNGNILTQKRSTGAGQVDDLSYKYKRDANGNLLRNQLAYVTDQIGGAVATDDIDTQLDTNYRYDELGNLRRDVQEQILRIEWTVYGKIKKVIRTASSTKSDLEFKYDASGNRIAKIEKPHGSSVENGGVDVTASWKSTYYVRDAQGNVMGNYYYTYPGTASYKLTERTIYGSSRLGSENTQVNMLASTLPIPFPRTLGNKYFEGSNHLGNVLSVFTDKKVPRDDNNNGIIDYFQPEVLSCSDYTAFGAPMTERSFSISQSGTSSTIYQSNFTSGVDGWVNNWAPASNTTISTVSSQLRIVANVQYGGAAQIVTTIPGKQYRFTLNIASISGLGANYLVYFARNASGSNIVVQGTTQPGVYTLEFTAQETTTRLCVELNTAGAAVQIASAKLELLPDLNYRYGFNGKENDREVVSTGSGTQDYGFRIYNPSLGRFLSIDPLIKKYPMLTPYQFSSDNPIANIDLDGLEGNGSNGAPTTTTVPASAIPSGRVDKDHPSPAPDPIDLSKNPTPQQVFDKFTEVVSYAAETSGKFTTGDYFTNIDPSNQVQGQINTANNVSAYFTFGLASNDVIDVIASPLVSGFSTISLNTVDVTTNVAGSTSQNNINSAVQNSTSLLFITISFNSVTPGSSNAATTVATNTYLMGVNNTVLSSDKQGTNLVRGFENRINSSLYRGDMTQKFLENRATFPNNAAAPPRTSNRNIRIDFNPVLIMMPSSSPGLQNTGIKTEY
jgi:RHS repeat-associated protein